MSAYPRPVGRLAALVFVFAAASACGDDDGGMTGNGGNRAPTASFTADPTVVPAGDNNTTIVTLDGSASSDPDGDSLTFSWTVPSGTFVNGTSASDEIAQVTFPGTAPYTVTLEVDDGNGGTDSFSFTVRLS